MTALAISPQQVTIEISAKYQISSTKSNLLQYYYFLGVCFIYLLNSFHFNKQFKQILTHSLSLINLICMKISDYNRFKFILRERKISSGFFLLL